MFLDFRGEIDIPSVFLEPGGRCDAEGLLIGAGGNVHDIYVILQHFGYFDPFVQMVASFYELVGAQPEFQREAGADRLADGDADLFCKTHTVFETAAVLVRAVVEKR